MRRLTWAQRFFLASLVILGVGMAGIGAWVGQQIETGVVHRTAATTALYVDSVVAPELQELAKSDAITPAHQQNLDQLFHATPLGQEIVSFKVWNRDGRILYSTEPANTGRVFPVEGGLARAWLGQVPARLSGLELEENVVERARGKPLLEIYSPVRRAGTQDIIAVAEFYQSADELRAEIANAQWSSWLIVGGATLVMYLLLAGFIQRASTTIARQQDELSAQVERLTQVLAHNAELDERVRRAAARTTALNERFLRRISAELHDGAAQDLGLALLQLDNVIARAEARRATPGGNEEREERDLAGVKDSITHALQEVRSTLTGLGVPHLQPLTLAETMSRVVYAHERRTGTTVQLQLNGLRQQAPLPVKITLYRVIQEALANAYRHAGGAGQAVRASAQDGQVCLEIADAGPGFDERRALDQDEHLGLVGMRERVESLGGTFRVESRSGQGTRVLATVPLRVEAMPGEL